MEKPADWALIKTGPVETRVSKYEHHERASEAYASYMSGFTQEEIAKFYGITVEEAEKDLQYIQMSLPTKLIIAHNNDRNRIILQREQSEEFRNLIKGALSIPARDYLAAGLSPASVMKEYRDAVGMTQKPEPLIQMNTQQNTYINNQPAHGITSSEDVIRRVLARIGEEESPIIDAETSEPLVPEDSSYEILDEEE